VADARRAGTVSRVTRDPFAIARKSMAAFSRNDLDAAIERFHPDVVWEVEAEMSPEAGTYRGRDGVREFWQTWHDHFARFELVVEDETELDDGRLLIGVHAEGTGMGSGAPVASGTFSQLFEVRDGLVVRVGLYASRSSALRAAGQAPPA